MGGLKFCLDKIGLGEHETAIINGKVNDRKEEGYEAQRAAVGAVEDYIKELESERVDIDNQIRSIFGFEFDDQEQKKFEAAPKGATATDWATAIAGDVVGTESTGFRQIIARRMTNKEAAKKLAKQVGGEVVLDGPAKWGVWRPVENPAAARPFVVGPQDQLRVGPERIVSKLLHQLGVQFEVLEGEDFYLVVKKSPYLDLVIERHAHPSGGDAIYFTHYIHDKEGSGDTWIDSEMVYGVTKGGHLVLLETAVPNPLTGGEHRGRDSRYARMFAKNLIAQGFGKRWDSMVKGDEKTETKPNEPELTENQRITIERLGPVGTKVQFTFGFNREVMTIADIEPEHGRVKVEGGGNIYREASEFKRAEETKAPAPDYAKIRAELEKEGSYVTPEKIIYAIEKTIADEWQYVKSYPSGLVVRSRTEETEKRAIDSVIDDIERDAKLGPAKPEPAKRPLQMGDIVKPSKSSGMAESWGGTIGHIRTHEDGQKFFKTNAIGGYQGSGNQHWKESDWELVSAEGSPDNVFAKFQDILHKFGEASIAGFTYRLVENKKGGWLWERVDENGIKISKGSFDPRTGGSSWTRDEARGKAIADADVERKAPKEPEEEEKPTLTFDFKRAQEGALRLIRAAGHSIAEDNLIISGMTKAQQAEVIQSLIDLGQVRRTSRNGATILELTEEESGGSPRARGASQQLGYWVLKKIESKEAFDWRELFEAADRYFGGTQAEGKYTPKDAYDAMELGVNFAIQRSLTIDMDASAEVAKRTINDLKALIERLPTQTKRTQEQVEYQQFSTPPPLAYVVGWTLKMDPEDIFLEPSAGIGGILVFAINADVKEVYANELSKRRAAILQSLNITKIFTEDAEHINNALPLEVRPTIIGMNPPFSSTAGRMATNKTKYGARHIEQALARLQPNGRLVAIVGRGMDDAAPAFQKWWKTIKARYNVRANISISGKEYAKYGTTFDNQIIVIDKTGPTKYNPVTGHAEKIEELIPLLEGVRNDRPSLLAGDQGNKRPTDQPAGPSTPGTPESPDRPPATLPGPTDNVGAGEGAAGTGAGPSGLPSGAPGSGSGGRGGTPTPGLPQPTDSQPDIDSTGPSGGTPRPDEGDRSGGRGSVDDDIDDLLNFSDQEAKKKAQAEKETEKEPEPPPEKLPPDKLPEGEYVIVRGNPISKLYVDGAYEKKLGAGTGFPDRAWQILQRNEQVHGLKQDADSIAGMATDLLNRPKSSYIDIDYVIQGLLEEAGYTVKANAAGDIEVKTPAATSAPKTIEGKMLRKGDRVRWFDAPSQLVEGVVQAVTVQHVVIETRPGTREHKLLTTEFELIERGPAAAPKATKPKKPKAPPKTPGALTTPAPPLLTPAEKDMTEKNREEAQKQIDKATKDFIDLFASLKKEDELEIDPQKWPAVHMALTEMWVGFKKAIASVKEAAQAFIRHAYSKLPARGKAYINKFIQEDIRAALENEKKEKDQLPPNELDYTDKGKNKAESPQELRDSLFDDYKPRVLVPGAKPHPSKLVQSVAMADTELPNPIYKILIPMTVIENGNISEAQIEAVVYSNQSFEVILPDGRRRGFFIGDGTGVGKGREIGAIIWENYLRGRKKAVWVSEKPDLMKDAARDLYGEQEDPATGGRRITGIGWEHGRKILFKAPNAVRPKRKKGEPARPRRERGAPKEPALPLPKITREEGIMFISYASLRKEFENIRPDQPASLQDMTIRLNQMVDWLGRDFDGVIAFDEAHNMRNLSPSAGARGSRPPAKQAQAGMLLSTLLPNARIVYVSATGAVEVENLVYADRLGLWGEGTAFTNGMRFVASLIRSGIAGMEMIARDLKARGLYIARALSYDDVEYDRMTHRLDDRQRATYDKMAEAWQGIFRGIHEAMSHTGGKKGQMWSMFWGSQQRFFDSVVTAMQMPSVIESAERDLDADHSVIFQLTKTGNAQAKRAYDNREEDQELEDLDLSPKEVLINFLMSYFPIQQWEPYTRPDGSPGMRPVYNDDGTPQINEEARQLRDALIADVNSIQGIPTSPLDMIVQHWGQDNVAEVTARGFRFVYNDEGKMIKEAWSKDKGVKDATTFMDGKKRILVFSEAGGTGASYHSDLDSKNQQKRIHYLLQSGWNAVRAVQGLGRSHRSNQAQAPKFWLVTTDIKGQMRFISTIARRLDQLGALTKGQRQTGSQGIFQARDNLENEYAREALVSLLLDIQSGSFVDQDGNVLITAEDFFMETGIRLIDEDGQRVPANEFPETPKFLNRALAMTLARQEIVFDHFFSRMDSVINRHAENGTLDVGIETISGTSVRKVSEQTVNVDELTSAETKYIQLEVDRPANNITFEASQKLFNYALSGESGLQYFQNIRSGRVWVASDYRSRSQAGQTVVYRTLRGPSETAVQQAENDVLADTEKWRPVGRDQAERLWNEEFNKLPTARTTTHHVLTAPLLPIWDRLQGDTRIYRMQTDDGERILGRVIPENQLAVTLENLGVTVELRNYDPAEVHREILDNNATAILVNGWELKRVNLSGDDRIELVGPDFYDFRMLQGYGIFQETVQFSRRFFVPTDSRGIQAIERLIRYKQVRTLQRPYSGPVLASVKKTEDMTTAELEAELASAPQFATTQEARQYGRESDTAEANEMLKFYAAAKVLASRYMADGNFDRAMSLATGAQYYREAYDGHQGGDSEVVAATEAWLKSRKPEVYPSLKKTSDSPFYSQMFDHLEAKLPGSGSTNDFINMIQKWAKEGKYKAEEMAWSGVIEYLSAKETIPVEKIEKAKESVITFKKVASLKKSSKKSAAEFKEILDRHISADEQFIRNAENQNRIAGGKVTKAQILEWLSENNIQIIETIFGESDSRIRAHMNGLREAGWQIEYDEDGDTEPLSITPPRDRLDDEGRRWGMSIYLRELNTDENAQSSLNYMVERGIVTELEREMIIEAANRIDEPRAIYNAYQFGGATNYRELVFSLPIKMTPAIPVEEIDTKGWRVITDAENEFTGQRTIRILDQFGGLMSSRSGFRGTNEEAIAHAAADEKKRLEKEYAPQEDRRANFYSTHYTIPNIVVHMRFNEREQPTYTEAEIDRIGEKIAKALNVADQKNLASGAPMAALKKGAVTPLEAAQFSHYHEFVGVDTTGATERILFVEEVQSDLHQKGRKLGYANPIHDRIIYKAEEGIKLTDEEMRIYREEMNSQAVTITGQPPDTPFKSTWTMLAMKRMVRWAAENGFNRIAWPTGEQQIDRYDEALRQNVDRIEWFHIKGEKKLVPPGYKIESKDFVRDVANPDDSYKIYRVIRADNRKAVTEWDQNKALVVEQAIESIRENAPHSWDFIRVHAYKSDRMTFDGNVADGKFISGPGKGKTLEEVLGKNITERVVKEETGDIKGKELSIGGQLHKFIYNVNLPQEMNKFFNKPAWGNARVAPYPLDLNRTGPAHFGPYTGPTATVEEVKRRYEDWNTPSQIRRQLEDMTLDMLTNDTPFEEAIRAHGSKAIAEMFGGTMEWVYPPMEVWSIPVTPEMRSKSVEKGMPLFSIKRMSPVAKTYLDALRAAMPSQFVTSKDDIQADPFGGLRDEVKERMQAAKGVPFAGFLQSAQIHGRDVWHSMTRHRPFLDAEEQSTVADVLRTHQDGPDNAIRRSMQVLQNIVGGMKPKQYEVFSLRIIMDDMIRDIDSGLLANKDELPFGFTETEARQYRDYLELIANSDPVISSAHDRRQAFQEKMKRALVEADLLPEAVLQDDRYFHHQVLIYRAKAAMGEAYEGLGVGSDDVRLKKKGWQIARVGSVADYNTDYAESEFEVLAQGFSQLETRETLDRIRALVDISSNLRAQAKQQNRTLFYDQEADRINRLNPGQPPLTGDDIVDTDFDPLKPYKKTIAIATSKLRKMAKDGKFAGMGQEWNDVITDLATGGRAAGGPMIEQSRFFGFLNHLMKAQLPGAVYAGTIRKAIAERDKYIKRSLGSRFVTVKKLIPEGWTEWKPSPGKSWYKAYSLSDRLVAAVQAGEMVIGPDNADKITQVLARGKDVVWIIPTGVAQTLDGFDKAHDDQKLSRASKAAMSAWKRWILINPYRVFRYNLNNLSGDLDITFAYDPKIVTHYLFNAIKDLTTEYRGKKELSQALQKELDLAYELSVLDSGWSFQEVSELTENIALMEKMEALRGDRPNVIKRGWRNLKEFTRYRENWLRLAAFRYFRDQISAGNTVYGASNRSEIDGITDPDRKAAKLARELIGDYGNVSHAGKFIRDHLLPFYSWMEINMPRYVRLMRNFRHEGRSGQARLAAVFGKNVTWKATKLAVKVSGFFVAVNLWNAAFFADEEDELSEDQRRQLHLILGRRADGSIRTIRIQGAFSDALSWFGMEDVIQDAKSYYKGRKSFGDIAKDSVLATPIKIINALRPDVKTGTEVLSEQAFYPDPFNPRPIRDKLEHVARMFSADSLYRWIAGKPKRGDNVGERIANDLMAIGFYYSDPGESAYYESISKVIKYREGKGKEYPGVTPTDKANALYYYKQGLKFGDLGAAEKYLRKYYALGGSDEGMDKSIQRAHPLGNLAQKDWGAYLKTLSPEEMNTYRRALAWYQNTYLRAPKAQLRAAAKKKDGEEEAPAARPGRLSLKEAAKMMK